MLKLTPVSKIAPKGPKRAKKAPNGAKSKMKYRTVVDCLH